jgi:hypothetical protein
MSEKFRGGPRGSAEVVFGEQLSRVLQAWRERYLLERNPEIERAKDWVNPKSLVISPIHWLSEMTDIHETIVGKIINGYFKFVPLDQAERILWAIDMEYLLRNEIHVIPNPRWTLEEWVEYMREKGCF